MRLALGYGAALLIFGLAAVPAVAQRGDGMGAFPQVREGRGDTLEAVFHQNGCTITYDGRTGRQLSIRSACTSAQRNFANNAIDDHRRASPAERLIGRDAYGRDITVDRRRDRRRARYAPVGRRAERPTISTDLNGAPAASFRAPACVVYYRVDGVRAGATQHCTASQLRRATREMNRWLAGRR